MRPGLLTLLAAVCAALATLLVTFAPWLRFGYRSVEAHASLETAAVLIAFVAAVLVTGRFRVRRQLDDLLLACALFGLSTANLVFATVPHMLGRDTVPAWVWAAVAARLGATTLFACAAFAPSRRLRSARGMIAAPAAASVLLLLVAVTVGFAVLDDVPLGIAASPRPDAGVHADLAGHPLLLGAQLAGALAFAAAAVGFLRKAGHDSFAGWLAVAAVLAAFSRVNYFLFPSIYSDWFYTGDVLRLAFYVCLLTAAVQEIRAHWQGLARAAVLEERRRLARDLHDGVAQELAYIRTQARSGAMNGVAASAERALDESRRAIAALTRRADDPLSVAITQVAEDVASRAGSRIAFELDAAADAPAETREALLRIVGEGITNAVRHGGADVVTVELHRNPLRLRIRDRGCGFDPKAQPPGGFGLTSMRERAERVGGEFSVRSVPGSGTEVEVVIA